MKKGNLFNVDTKETSCVSYVAVKQLRASV